MRKYLRLLFLAIVFQCFHINVHAQIDVPKWVDDIGGPNSNCISSFIQVDKQNNVYVAGFFSGTADFDPSATVHNLTAKGSFDTFVAKYTPDGKYIWAVSIGGSSVTQVTFMTVDKDGNPLLSGQFDSGDLDANPGPGTSILSTKGGNDCFVIKLNTNGGFVWAKSIGSEATDYGSHISADSQGNVIECVRYQETVNVEGKTFTSAGGFNGLIIKYAPNGSLIWAINLSDTNDLECNFADIDSQDNIIVTGHFTGNDNFNPLGTAVKLSGDGMFFAKYNSAGILVWANRFLGATVGNNINLCVNSKGDVFADGPFNTQLNFSGTKLTPQGSQDLFLVKYSSNGDFQSVRDVGSPSGSIFNYGIQASKDDNIYAGGYFSGSIDFDPSLSTSSLISSHGSQDFFLAKYDENLNYKWAFNGGSPNCSSTLGRSIAIDNNNDVLFSGGFCSTVNFSASTCTPFPLTAQSSSRDCFLGKYTQNTATAASQITGFSVPQQSAPAVIDQANLNITVTVPTGTDITALLPTITHTTGVTLTPASGTAENFSSGVTYKLTSSCASLNYSVNVVFSSSTGTNPTICATSGSDGTTNINGSINTYFPPSGNLTLTASSNSIAVGAVPATDTHGNNFGNTPIKAGDLLLIIQMQDASINYSNTTLYGSNSATAGYDALGATGFTNLGNSGRYEYVIATNDVPLTGGVLKFKGSGTANGTVYTYTNAAANATMGQRTFQVIRLPQYANLRLSSNISPPPFNGKAGGIIAFSVAGKMDFNGYTIDVSGRGFRGGYSLIKTTGGVNLNDLYVANAADNRVSGKGEGIAGTPRYMWDGYNQVDNSVEGLPGGSGGRGAPANAGGGGNDVNSGGGGGGNGGDGGVGGYGYEVDPGTFPNGGRPGSVDYSGTIDDTRLNMGGGGGGGHANDALTGVKGGVGGGIVIINASTIIGTGTILANGGDGQPGTYGGHPDGSGGGGAGGTVFVKVATPDPTAVLTINAIGGKGGNTQFDDPNTTGVEPHGPGGGGGGGLVFYAISAGTIKVNTAGGISGKTNNGAGITHNAANGSTGMTSAFAIGSLPPYLQGNSGICYPQLVTTMAVVNPGVPVLPGDVVNYVVKITNTATDGSAGGVEANISFPAAVSFTSATVKYTGTASGPATITNTGTPVLPSFGDFNIAPGDSVILAITAKINCITSGTYNSSAQAIYLDPTRDYTQPNRRITAATNAFSGANTTYQTTKTGPVPGSNYDGTKATAEDVTVVNTPIANNTITAPAVVSFCSTGDAANIVGSTPTGGTGVYTYQWQNSTDNVTFVNITGATGKDYDPPLLNTTMYYLRVVTSGTCAAPLNSSVVSIKVSTQPVAPAPFTQSICPGATATLTIADAQTGIIYNWYDSAAKTNLLFTGATYTTGPLNTNATYYVEAANGACVSTTTAIVQVNIIPLPAAPTVVSPVTACDGASTSLNVSNPQTGLTYNWYTVPTDGTLITSGSSITVIASTSNAVYYVAAVNTNGCIGPRSEVDITVVPIPSAPVVTAPLAICAGSATTLNITNSQPGITYSWYAAETDQTPLTTGTQFNTPALSNNTSYYVEAVSNTGGCTSTRTAVLVPVTQLPVAPANLTQAVCIGSPVTLTLTDAQTGITYNWYDSPAKTTVVFTGTSYTINAVNSNATYYVEAINGACPAVSLATVQVNVIASPSTPDVVKSVLQTCANTQVTLSVANPQSGLTYNWYTTQSGGNPVGTGADFLTPALTSGATYYVEAANSNSCVSPRTSVNVNVSPLPGINAQGASTCPGTSTSVTASSSDPNATINWYSSATGGNPIATGNSFPTPVLNSNTTYYAEATNSISECASSTRAAAIVTIYTQLPAPVVSVDGTTSSTITFKWAAVAGATGYLVSTDNGATYTDPSSGSNGLTHTINGLQEGQTATILVEATGASNCQLSGSSTAVTGVAHDTRNDIIYVANAFTPNGDGKNDVAYVHSNNIKSMIFYIYDQYGEMIFRSTDINLGWDGTYKGTKQPVGVYVYFVQATMNDGEKLTKKGTITLLR